MLDPDLYALRKVPIRRKLHGYKPRRYIDVTDKAVESAYKLGLGREKKKTVRTLIGNMVYYSEAIDHPKGNRIYKGYILKCVRGVVYDLCTHDGREQTSCPACQGASRKGDFDKRCDLCDSTGIIILG